MKAKLVVVNDLMQQGYEYYRTEPVGKNFDDGFEPQLTPQQMLELGVFGGRYMTDCLDEFPASWFRKAKLSPGHHDKSLNYFGVDASQPLAEWRRRNGSESRIRAAGSSGTAATTQVGAAKTMSARSGDGARWRAMSLR